MHPLRYQLIVMCAFGLIALAIVGMRFESGAPSVRSVRNDTEVALANEPALAAEHARPIARAIPTVVQPRAAAHAPVRASGGRLTEDMFQLDPQDTPPNGEPPREDPSDEVALEGDNRPEQREWRATWMDEAQNPSWTENMKEQLEQRASGMLSGKLDVLDADCRQTLCILHVKFDNELDAEAFRNAEHDDAAHYEFQSLDPNRNDDGFDDSDYGYELIVKREP